MVGVQFSGAQRTFMVTTYIRTGSIDQTRTSFIRRYPGVNPPHRNSILYNFRKYQDHHTSLNRNHGHSGRRRTGRSAFNIRMVARELANNPSVSIRRNNLPNLSASTFNRIVRLDLNFHPYVMIMRHRLLPADLPRRVQFCQWLIARPQRFMGELIISDEASFPVNGGVNTHNVRHYASRGHPPDFNYDIPLDKSKITVWVGLKGNDTIIGPFIFYNNVNGQGYLDMINNEVVPALQALYQQQRNGAFPRLWWAQDGAPAHRTIAVRNRLQQLFPRRVIGIGHNPEWPARSPDLTPLDFFLWGYLKSKVYHTPPPANLQEVEARVRVEVTSLRRNRGMVRRAVRNMLDRAHTCLQQNGGHVEGRLR